MTYGCHTTNSDPDLPFLGVWVKTKENHPHQGFFTPLSPAKPLENREKRLKKLETPRSKRQGFSLLKKDQAKSNTKERKIRRITLAIINYYVVVFLARQGPWGWEDEEIPGLHKPSSFLRSIQGSVSLGGGVLWLGFNQKQTTTHDS